MEQYHRDVDDHGDGSADSNTTARTNSIHEGEHVDSSSGHLFARAPAPEIPLSQPFSVDLVAPPNSHELDERSRNDDSDVAMLSQELDDGGDDSSTTTTHANTNDASHTIDNDMEMNENAIQVREILADMLRAESIASTATTTAFTPAGTSAMTKERERDEREQLQMHQLRCCVIDDASLGALEQLPKRMCAYEFKPGDIAWNCRVCQVDETCVMCNDCFISSDHDDHEVFFYYTQSGGCCDCGDTEAWAAEGFCTRHKGAQDADPLRLLPHDLLVNARACIRAVMEFVVTTVAEARHAYVIDASGVDRVRQKLANASSDARFAVVVHYHEYLNSQEFTAALSAAHPGMPFQIKKLDEIVSQRQVIVRAKATRDEAIDLAQTLFAHGIYSSVVSSDYRGRLFVTNTLFHWLASMANLSDGICRLICEQFISDSNAISSTLSFPMLRTVILADSFLPKSGSDALHSLLMALLADPIFKKAFAIAFTSAYPQLYREHVAGIGSVSSTILTFGVQFFNRASFVKLLASEYELLEVITATALETLRKRPTRDAMEIPFDGAWDSVACVLHPLWKEEVSVWDLFALALLRRSDAPTLEDVDVAALVREARTHGFVVRGAIEQSVFLHLPHDTALPGRCELDVNSPVFLHRRYLCGLMDLRYALQIDGVSEAFVVEKHGKRYAEYLLYLSYVQGINAETRRRGDHVETESRSWLFAVEFASTVSDVFTLVLLNAFKEPSASTPRTPAQLQNLVTMIAKPIFDAYFFWLAAARKYFPPPDFQVGDTLRPDQVERSVSCHFPLHRTIAQLVRTLSNARMGLTFLYALLDVTAINPQTSVWTHDADSPIGFWHRVHLIEPVLQAIVWDAQVHSGLWVRNGSSVISHSMNYGEPPFCTRFRDVDLLLLQFGFHLLRVDWMMASILTRFDIDAWFDADDDSRYRDANTELMVTECLTLLCHLASELPPKVALDDPLRSLTPYLRREILQRLCVGPCAHSDLSKIATEFFLTHENLFPNNFSSGPVLDQLLKELCVPSAAALTMADASGGSSTTTSSGGDAAGGKFQYRLKPELFAEYNPTFIHLSRKQHEFAHENWFQQRVRHSKAREAMQEDGSRFHTHASWLDFPIVNTFLPCPQGFRITRVAVLHAHARRVVYEAFWKASRDPQSSLSLLSRAVHLFTLQLYVIEDVRYNASLVETASDRTDDGVDSAYLEEAQALVDSFVAWVTTKQTRRRVDEDDDVNDDAAMDLDDDDSSGRIHPPVLDLLLQLNPWSVASGGDSCVTLDGDQKHEIGRGVDWLLHRLARLDAVCRDRIEQYQLTQKASQDEEDRKLKLTQRRKEAQQRAMLQMQRQQAAFAEQMKVLMGGSGEADDSEDTDGTLALDGTDAASTGFVTDTLTSGDVDMGDDSIAALAVPTTADAATLPECAMCHSTESEDSFMCFIGFAQCSPVFSRQNNGTTGAFLSTPIDEMHVGEDVPIHVRLCGHSVHHTCWKSYHESQFQRAITGGHHRHALNAVDVTKNEFLCPLCKSISNVLIPTTANEMTDLQIHEAAATLPSSASRTEPALLEWLTAHGRVSDDDDERVQAAEHADAEQKAALPMLSSTVADTMPVKWGENTPQKRWLEQGLGSLCMAIHRVACGAMQQSRPERYTTSGCNALYHTLLCTFLSTPHARDQIQPEQRLLQAMRFVPQMLDQVARRNHAAAVDTTASGVRSQLAHLFYYGGSDVRDDGSIVLETEHPSTQTQTRKQSQWNKVRCPAKPLLLHHLGSVLAKGFLLARSALEAEHLCRLAVLARIIQTLVWFAVTRTESFTDSMADTLEHSDENVAFFLASFTDVETAATSEDDVAMQLVTLLQLLTQPLAARHPHVLAPIRNARQLLNVVACEVVPMVRVAVFLLEARDANTALAATRKPSSVTPSDVRARGFLALRALLPPPPVAAADSDDADVPVTASPLQVIVARWVARFQTAYDEMSDPHGVLSQWLTSANADKPTVSSAAATATAAAQQQQELTLTSVLARDLHTMHSTISLCASGASRTRYLRSLPRAYVKFYSELAKRKCDACHQFPARPAVCLLCGALLCAANTCPALKTSDSAYREESNPGACTLHAKKCGRGSGMFLLVLEGAVLLVYWKLSAYVGSLYVDEYGEEFGERNRELNKGRPLYLNIERRERLLRLWLRHEIPYEVVKIQNSSERVIRNSHY